MYLARIEPRFTQVFLMLVRGEGLGVARQRADCHKLAESRGSTITEDYVDNDLSAQYQVKRARSARNIG